MERIAFSSYRVLSNQFQGHAQTIDEPLLEGFQPDYDLENYLSKFIFVTTDSFVSTLWM